MSRDKREKKKLLDEIKQMEAKARDEALKARVEASPDVVEFDVWFNMRSSIIPGRHMKEIIFADFKGRGLGDKALVAEYDQALQNYGIKLS